MLSVSRTVTPEGMVKHHPFGMPLPKVKCMDKVMKEAVIREIQEGQKQAINTARTIINGSI